MNICLCMCIAIPLIFTKYVAEEERFSLIKNNDIFSSHLISCLQKFIYHTLNSTTTWYLLQDSNKVLGIHIFWIVCTSSVRLGIKEIITNYTFEMRYPLGWENNKRKVQFILFYSMTTKISNTINKLFCHVTR